MLTICDEDALFIGPNDLASSMGYFAFDHAKISEVQEATARILKAAKSAGKFAGHFALSAQVAAQKSKEGFDFMNCGADIVALTTWMAKEMGDLNNLLAVDVHQTNGATANDVITNGSTNGEIRYNKTGY
jgi:4-hydroxy-2-oxoheptanedioate aldolase